MILYAAPLLSPEACRLLIDAFERLVGSSTERDFSGQPVVRWPFPGNPIETAVFCLILKCHDTALKKAYRLMDLSRRRLLVETTILTRMGPGGWHEPHADNCKRDAAGNWVPNHTPHRTHTAIVYLSTPDAGGELYFPQHGVKLRPRAGHIAVFPSDGEHEHGVRPVKAGLRYSLAMWLTADRGRVEPG